MATQQIAALKFNDMRRWNAVAGFLWDRPSAL